MNLVDTPVSFLQVLISGGLKSFVLEVLILLELKQHPFQVLISNVPRKADPSVATLLTRESS